MQNKRSITLILLAVILISSMIVFLIEENRIKDIKISHSIEKYHLQSKILDLEYKIKKDKSNQDFNNKMKDLADCEIFE